VTTYARTWALDNIEISRAHTDGRTVEAYCAIFDTPYEVMDQHGHYMEVIDRAAFNRTLSHGLSRVSVLFNHGMTVHGTPDMLGSVPLGTPLEIRPDGRGLLTVTRYNRSALADATLEAIRAGDIKSQSFRGRVFRSTPMRPPRVRPGQSLPTVTRHELGLADYGPTPIPVNDTPMMVAVRSTAQLAVDLAGLDEAARADLIRMLSTTPAADPETAPATPDPESGPGAEDPHDPQPVVHSGRQSDITRRIRVSKITRSM
jgi:HK97 family phage prohead protease